MEGDQAADEILDHGIQGPAALLGRGQRRIAARPLLAVIEA
jgi:hypothetical protein